MAEFHITEKENDIRNDKTNDTENYTEIVEGLVIFLDEEETKILSAITGSIAGGGKIRDFSNHLFHSLPDFHPNRHFEQIRSMVLNQPHLPYIRTTF